MFSRAASYQLMHNGTQFVTPIFENFYTLLETKWVTISAYHIKGSGQEEVFIKNIISEEGFIMLQNTSLTGTRTYSLGRPPIAKKHTDTQISLM